MGYVRESWWSLNQLNQGIPLFHVYSGVRSEFGLRRKGLDSNIWKCLFQDAVDRFVVTGLYATQLSCFDVIIMRSTF